MYDAENVEFKFSGLRRHLKSKHCRHRFYFKRRKAFNYLKKNCSSKGVIFLQETHSVKQNEEMWNNQWGSGKI